MSTPTLSTLRRPSTRAVEHVAPEPGAGTRPVGRRLAVALALAAILGIYAARCLAVAGTDSITSDESTYLIHGLHYWSTGDDLGLWELGTPRLPHLIHTWGSYQALRWAGLLGPAGAGDRLAEIRALVLSGSARILLPARCLAIGWGLGLLLVVYWGGRPDPRPRRGPDGGRTPGDGARGARPRPDCRQRYVVRGLGGPGRRPPGPLRRATRARPLAGSLPGGRPGLVDAAHRPDPPGHRGPCPRLVRPPIGPGAWVGRDPGASGRDRPPRWPAWSWSPTSSSGLATGSGRSGSTTPRPGSRA